MGLFKSQKSRNKRIFKETFYYLLNEMEEMIEEEFDYHTHATWFFGACVLAQNLVEKANNIKKAWGAGNNEKAIALYEVCVQPMISIWYRNIDMQVEHSEEEKRKARELAISNVLNILGAFSEDKLRDFLNLDVQYKYDMDVREQKHISLYYADLFMSKIAEAAGFRGYINWPEQTFPVNQNSYLSFVDDEKPYGDFGYDFKGVMLIPILIPIASIQMFRYYELVAGIKEE